MPKDTLDYWYLCSNPVGSGRPTGRNLSEVDSTQASACLCLVTDGLVAAKLGALFGEVATVKVDKECHSLQSYRSPAGKSPSLRVEIRQ